VLGRHGYKVGLYEGRPDSRLTSIYQGKSINIALSDRGWRVLEHIGVSSDTKADAVPMYHRAIHGVNGELSALPYGKEGDAIWSVSRGGINEQLLDAAVSESYVESHFEHWLVDVEF
jgi:kynurenine 3-monooxygenase